MFDPPPVDRALRSLGAIRAGAWGSISCWRFWVLVTHGQLIALSYL